MFVNKTDTEPATQNKTSTVCKEKDSEMLRHTKMLKLGRVLEQSVGVESFG